MRARIDLDGVPLADPSAPQMVVAIFRHRTVEGLVLLVPESADVLVPWAHVERAAVDLLSGRVRIELDPAYVARQSWLPSATLLEGTWTDRVLMERAVAAATRLD